MQDPRLRAASPGWTWRKLLLAGLNLAVCVFLTQTALAQNAFRQQNLVSDLPGVAANLDPNLVNPWGIAFTATSPFWISDNGSGLSTLYNGSGTPSALVVTIPPPAGGAPPAAPDGIIANSTTNFPVAPGKPAKFIFSTEDGTISGWASGSSAVLEVDNSGAGTVYKGIAAGVSGTNTYLYAADFHNNRIDVFDTGYHPVTLAGTFADPTIPTGFAPFNVQNFGGWLYVTYALQDDVAHDDVPGPGNGYVNIFNTSGVLQTRLISNGALNSPWGLALAPAGFGPFGGDLLVANFGDGTINAFNPTNGVWQGSLNDTNGDTFSVLGLWGLSFGNGGSGGSPGTLYFTAGIPGSGAVEDHGLFGSLTPLFPGEVSPLSYNQQNLVSDLPGMANNLDTNLVNPWGIAYTATGPFWISDNGSGLSTVYSSGGTPASLIVTIPPPAGGTPPAAPDGIIANSTTNFPVTPGKPAKFIFSTEDGTISGWNSGTSAVLKVDNSAAGTVYKGVALGVSGGNTYLYAVDFHNNRVDVFDTGYNPVTLAGTFADPTIPAGFAPFNIQNLGGLLYVTYALQDSVAHDDVSGPGNGYVNIFSTSGVLQARLVSSGPLNSPWGLALAPVPFGGYGGALLIGNFGDGRINAFNPTNGLWLGPLYAANGDPFSVEGLWGLIFGNGSSGGDAHTLYFTAGIPGSGAREDHGLFGSLSPVYPAFTSIAKTSSSVVFNWAGGSGSYQVQMTTNLIPGNWVGILSTTNHSATNLLSAPTGYFRILNQ